MHTWHSGPWPARAVAVGRQAALGSPVVDACHFRYHRDRTLGVHLTAVSPPAHPPLRAASWDGCVPRSGAPVVVLVAARVVLMAATEAATGLRPACAGGAGAQDTVWKCVAR